MYRKKNFISLGMSLVLAAGITVTPVTAADFVYAWLKQMSADATNGYSFIMTKVTNGAVLTLDSEPVHQNTGKPVIGTTLVIRLILDRAATTEEAVELLNQYDMFATSGRDYHFYITDASGDGRVVEYDCESETREMVATPIRSITNFFGLYGRSCNRSVRHTRLLLAGK